MKRIVIEKIRCFDGWAFRIVEQTHREGKFGKDGQNFFQGSKLKLKSHSYPSYPKVFHNKDVFVCGSDKLKDNTILLATDSDMSDLEQAIKEYNEFFSDDFKAGDRVWDIVEGEGIIESINSGNNAEYPVSVRFKNNNSWTYTKEGKFFISHILPSLYKYPVEIVIKFEDILRYYA